MAAPRRGALLFLCVANSARSQMAEGIARTLAPPELEIHSAGSDPGRLNPLAVAALAEIGIDISGQRAKGIDAVPVDRIDRVVTLCAEEVCPAFPRPVEKRHWPLPDPAAAGGSEEERLAAFREVREALRERIASLLAERMSVRGVGGEAPSPSKGGAC
ncbi:MAG: arsenate reductase ArsC [Candidatus Eisenbacteria bacterium]|nr:arsenate reductase ArsC [Candidatus Latescibacterota bacterium]MBD3300847.1 arsenate reductase ArsC [Candidatus Eisenbacteria bacterium]